MRPFNSIADMLGECGVRRYSAGSMDIHVYIYIYIYIERERERERIPLLWSTIRERAVTKGFRFNVRVGCEGRGLRCVACLQKNEETSHWQGRDDASRSSLGFGLN